MHGIDQYRQGISVSRIEARPCVHVPTGAPSPTILQKRTGKHMMLSYRTVAQPDGVN